jgi:hypothetical protein
MGSGQAKAAPTHDGAFRLVCAACRWPRGEPEHAQLRALAQNVDWAEVERLIVRHRIPAIVHHALTSAGISPPEAHAERILSQAGQTTRSALMLASETVRMHRLFEAAGIDALTVKGAPLAIAAWGTLSLKTSIDVDLLIAPEAMPRAAALLREAGYQRTVPGPDVEDPQLGEWVLWFKETNWAHPERRSCIDLHGRLIGNPRLAPGIGLSSPRQRIAIGGQHVTTLAAEPLYAYLCVHGTDSGWARLKWLADLGALVAGCEPERVIALHDYAEAQGVGRCSAQALLLANRVLSLPLPDALDARLRARRSHRMMVRLALRALRDGSGTQAPRHDSRAGLPILSSRLLARPGIAPKLGEIGMMIANPRDRARGRLPRWAGFLYPALSVSRWIGRRVLGQGARG